MVLHDHPLKALDTVQNEALPLCLGAFRTSPADSLEVEADVRINVFTVYYSLFIQNHESHSSSYAV